MTEVTQEDINTYVENTVKNVGFDNYITFLYDNYKVLLKNNLVAKRNRVLINSVPDHFRYTAPEVVLLYIKIVAFYMALEHYKIPCENWT